MHYVLPVMQNANEEPNDQQIENDIYVMLPCMLKGKYIKLKLDSKCLPCKFRVQLQIAY